MPPVEGIKLISHNAGGFKIPDDPAYGDYLLTITCRVQDFMEVAATFILGEREQVVVRGKTAEALEHFIQVNQFRTHPRLLRLHVVNTTLPQKCIKFKTNQMFGGHDDPIYPFVKIEKDTWITVYNLKSEGVHTLGERFSGGAAVGKFLYPVEFNASQVEMKEV